MFRMSKQSLHLFKVMTQIYKKKYILATMFRFHVLHKIHTARRIDIHYLLYPHEESIFFSGRYAFVYIFVIHRRKFSENMHTLSFVEQEPCDNVFNMKNDYHKICFHLRSALILIADYWEWGERQLFVCENNEEILEGNSNHRILIKFKQNQPIKLKFFYRSMMVNSTLYLFKTFSRENIGKLQKFVKSHENLQRKALVICT